MPLAPGDRRDRAVALLPGLPAYLPPSAAAGRPDPLRSPRPAVQPPGRPRHPPLLLAAHPPGGYENVAFAESLPAVATIVYVPFSSPSGTHHSDG